MSIPLANLTPAPVVESHGHFSGDVNGAEVLLFADIGYQELVNSLQAVAAKYATVLANDENTIQSQVSDLQNKEYKADGIADLIKIINEGKVDLKPDQEDVLRQYTTQIGLYQTEGQAATKAIDPVLTTEQNQPSALQQAANEFIQEVGTLNQGMQALANDRIG